MNFMSVLGLFLGVGVLITGMMFSTSNLLIFFDKASIFIVLGGTFAAGSIAFKLTNVAGLFIIFFKRFVLGQTTKPETSILEVIKVANAVKNGASFKSQSEGTRDMFFREGLDMLNDGVISKDDLVEIMETRSDKILEKYMDNSNQLKSIGKFAPAFGMIGTTIGMIVLLANLGASEDAMKTIGPAMAVALITTLYGSILANLLLVPVAENLEKNAKEIFEKNDILVKGLELLADKQNPIMVAEVLNSYVLPAQRVDWKKAI